MFLYERAPTSELHEEHRDCGSLLQPAPRLRLQEIEVRRALWVPLEESARKLAYRGEREMVKRAQEYVKSHLEA